VVAQPGKGDPPVSRNFKRCPIDPLTKLRLQRGAEHLHCLGPRATAELLSEIAYRIGGMPCIIDLLGEYQHRVTPEILRAVGGDRFPPRLQLVPSK
jgi:hypothetical protein